MPVKIIVFDLDGTLIDSNRLKYDAFFELFKDDQKHVPTIQKVLSESKEQSRFVILEKILRRLGYEKGNELSRRIKDLAARYNDIVLTGAKTSSEMPGADKLLRSLSSRYRLYVSSTTPEDPLREIVQSRGWAGLFVDVFGYPSRKSETIQHIFKRENTEGSEVLVVGDGETDRQSAVENGCYFVHVTEDFRLKDLEDIIKRIVND